MDERHRGQRSGGVHHAREPAGVDSPIDVFAQTTALLRARLAHLVLLTIVGAYFIVLWAAGGRSHWDVLGVAPLPFRFGDLRGVTSAWECTRQGLDVLVANPCDPFHRASNYPGIWMAPSHLGLGVGDTVWLGWTIIGVYLAAAVRILESSARVLDAVVYGAALCSPAIMLGVERGNVDLLIFTIVLLAVLLYRRIDRWPVGHALLLFAAILKLFPIFAAGAFLRDRSRRSLVLLGAVFAGFAVYCLWILHELRVIWRIPQAPEYAYGIRTCSEWIASWAGKTSLRAIDVGVLALVAVVLLVVRRRWRTWLPADSGSSARRDLELFVAGAGIYVFSYMLFRSYEYRLVFLLLTLPQLLSWARAGRVVAQLTLFALFAVLYLDLRPKANVFGFDAPHAVVAVEQICLFALLAGGLIATLPVRRSAAPIHT